MEYTKISLMQVCKNAYRLIADNPMACAMGVLLYGIASLLLIGGLTLVNWSLIKDLIISHPVIQTDNIANTYIAYFKNHIAVMVTSYVVYMIGSTIVYAGSLLFFLTLYKKNDLTLSGIVCTRRQAIAIIWYFILRLLLIAGVIFGLLGLGKLAMDYGSLILQLILALGSVGVLIACINLLIHVAFVPEVIIDKNSSFANAVRTSWYMAEGNASIVLLVFSMRFIVHSIMAWHIGLFILTPLIALLWVSAYILIKEQKNMDGIGTTEVVE